MAKRNVSDKAQTAACFNRRQAAELMVASARGQIEGWSRLISHHRGEADKARAHGALPLERKILLQIDKLELKRRLLRVQLREYETALRQSTVASAAGSAPRPTSNPEIRQRVLAMMQRERHAGTEFKVLLRRWEREKIDGLALTVSSTGAYWVEDENSNVESRRSYTIGTLRKLYSNSKAA